MSVNTYVAGREVSTNYIQLLKSCLEFDDSESILVLTSSQLQLDHTYEQHKARRAGLLRTVGGQHKNYPIINNIPKQREQPILKGLSLQLPVVD